ncbi:uncharacterized protein LOC122001689 [Zingiber officinale]|uniref:DUF1639 family protein n=1 Tax=Zingiber officinale TaxID=94328 RepID=A0A8J5KW81_ZINOF|nr:uncharacterized protein LOC122001689 [Zingiber officinale]XP_042412511.1 uncharacterized protein LOC122001689 [Zingiber officinale]XP_042412512.1 uncharacterized protein LOC122001689 [Zingiber officinale]KAG6492978.1 hypothetical protein ZIOFF_047950 [Zingiber officinale]
MATAQDSPRGELELELEPNLRHRLPLPRWGDRRTSRRPATDRGGGDRTPTAGPLGCGRSPPAQDGGGGGEDGGLEELRAKLMGHLRVAADRMKIATSEAAPEVSRPWNLRARKTSNGNGGCGSAGAATAAAGGAAATATGPAAEEERKRKIGLTVPLTAEEIEEDVYALTGSRPRRRPKKRPRVVQRQIDSLFPGLWLSDITVESYKVDDD